MRAWACFWVVLHAEEALVQAGESFDGVVVEIDVRYLRSGFGQAARLDGEAMVLAGDFDLAGSLVSDGLVAASMAKLQLVCLGSQSQREHLVPQADAEERHLADQALQGFDGVGYRRWVARAVGYEHAVGLAGEDFR